MLKDKVETIENPIGKINETIDYIAPKLGKTQKELLELLPDEISRLYEAAVKEELIKLKEQERMFIQLSKYSEQKYEVRDQRIKEIGDEIKDIKSGKIFIKGDRKIEQVEDTNVFEFTFNV